MMAERDNEGLVWLLYGLCAVALAVGIVTVVVSWAAIEDRESWTRIDDRCYVHVVERNTWWWRPNPADTREVLCKEAR